MKSRKLRIAWSAFWAVASVLLVVLWVRSYGFVDGFYIVDWHSAVSARGNLYIDAAISSDVGFTQYKYGRHLLYSVWSDTHGIALHDQQLVVPIWVLAILLAACATFP